jgi:hypothetical protein
VWIGIAACEPYSSDVYAESSKFSGRPIEMMILDEVQRFGTVQGYKDWYKAGRYHISDNRKSPK